MAHLNISELVNLADSFYICLFGVDIYLRWKKIKSNSHCESERGFVKWMLDICEQHVNANASLPSTTVAGEPSLPADVINGDSEIADDGSSSHSLAALIKAFGGTQDLIDGVKKAAAQKRQDDEARDNVADRKNDAAETATNKVKGLDDIIFVDDDEYDIDSEENCMNQITHIVPQTSSESMKNSVFTGADDSKMYNCDLCCGTFKTLSNMKRHKICCHNSTKEYKCAHCSAVFCSKADKLVHEERTHCDKIHLHHCGSCRKKFRTKFSLAQHVDRIHRGNKAKLMCTMCNKSFSYNMTLKSHIRTVHLGIKDHECDICRKRFGKKYELEYHQHLKHF